MVGPARENRDMARYAAAPHPRVLFALVAALVLALAGCSGAGGAGGGSEGGSGGELDRNAALRAATWANDVARAEQLIAAGADVNAKDETQQSAFLITTSEGYDAILDLTLAHGARVDDLDSWNGTGLIRAAERGHHTTVGRLLRAGIARDHVNRIGFRPSTRRCGSGRPAPRSRICARPSRRVTRMPRRWRCAMARAGSCRPPSWPPWSGPPRVRGTGRCTGCSPHTSASEGPARGWGRARGLGSAQSRWTGYLSWVHACWGLWCHRSGRSGHA